MRSPDARTYRLTFTLPTAARDVQSGVFTGWVKDCELNIAGRFVAVIAPSRERAQEQAAKLLRIACHGVDRAQTVAILESPAPVSGRDSWTIVINADIAFVPGAIGAVFPELEHGQRAAMV